MGEVLFMGLTSVFAVVLFFLTKGFPVSIVDRSGGAALFPRIGIVLLIFFIAIRTFIVLKDQTQRKQPFIFLEIFTGPRLVYLLSVVMYIVLLKPIGFILMTILFLWGMAWYLHFQQKKWLMTIRHSIVLLVVVIVLSISIYILFKELLNVMLPQGIITLL